MEDYPGQAFYHAHNPNIRATEERWYATNMSRKNISKTEHVSDNKVHVTFDTTDGKRTYEYVGSSARAIKRGKTDPSQLAGRLVRHEK